MLGSTFDQKRMKVHALLCWAALLHLWLPCSLQAAFSPNTCFARAVLLKTAVESLGDMEMGRGLRNASSPELKVTDRHS